MPRRGCAQDDVELAARAAEEAAVGGARGVGGKHRPQRACEALARQVDSTVRFGVAPENLSLAAGGNRTCYASDDYSSGTLHTARRRSLAAMPLTAKLVVDSCEPLAVLLRAHMLP